MYPNVNKEAEIRIFKTKNFIRWARKEKIADMQLRRAISEIEAGLIDSDLGGGLIKKRVARAGQGKRGGYRMLLAFKSKERSIFMFGISKNDRENLDADEKNIYKQLAKLHLDVPIGRLEKMCIEDQLVEIDHEKK